MQPTGYATLQVWLVIPWNTYILWWLFSVYKENANCVWYSTRHTGYASFNNFSYWHLFTSFGFGVFGNVSINLQDMKVEDSMITQPNCVFIIEDILISWDTV